MTRHHRLTLLALAVLVTTLGACAPAPRQRPVKGGPVNTGTGSTKAARSFLEGRWTLLTFEVFPPGQPPITVAGEGSLLYDDFGNLKMDIRVDEKTGAALSKAGIPIQAGVLSIEGRAVIDMAGRKLTYVLEGQPPIGAPAGPLAMNRPRYWEVSGDELILTTRDEGGNALSVARWKKQG